MSKFNNQMSPLESETIVFKGVVMSLEDVIRMRYSLISKMFEYMRANKLVINKMVDNLIRENLTENDQKKYQYGIDLTQNERYYIEPDWY